MLRAGPFSDSRVVTLVNACFVPVYFDLGKGSPAADDAARDFVVRLDPRLGGASVPTPDVFAVTAEGEQLGKASNYATEVDYLEMLRDVVRDAGLHDESESEAALPVDQRAWLRLCKGDAEGARALLDDAEDDAARLMSARVLRLVGELDAARAALEGCSDEVDADVAVELGRTLLLRGDLAAACASFDQVDPEHRRHAEAEYFTGVARFHQDRVDDAKAIWTALIESYGENVWSYRADWAIEGAKERKSSRVFSSIGGKTTLGRHGYMGRRNPDLEPIGRDV